MEELLAKSDFRTEFDRLVNWFRVQKSITSEHASKVFDRMKSFPVKAVRAAVDAIIDERRPSPGNFPTIGELYHHCAMWLDQHPDEKLRLTNFDPVEDFRFPVQKLWDGFNVLMGQGWESFGRFCRTNRVPKNDIDRVISKFNYLKSQDKIQARIEAAAASLGGRQ